MHVLIIPSEQFVPEHDPLAGTFQFDQAKILEHNNFKVGVISIQLKYSLPMIVRGLLLRLVSKKAGNATDNLNATGLIKLLSRKIFSPSSFVTQENKEGIKVYRVEGFYWLPPSEKTDYLFWVRTGMVAFKKYIADNGIPGVIHAHNALYAGLLADKIKSVYKIPFVLTEHSSYYGRGLYHHTLLQKALRPFQNANPMLVVSNFLGKEIENTYKKKIKWTVLPNVVEPIFEKVPLNTYLHTDPFLFISIGSLIELKKHALLINAFHQAFSKSENVQLEIIGEGEKEEMLHKLILELGESERIFLNGRLTKEEVFNKINKANALCHQSEYETFGVVVLEALFRGVPVISTKCGGVNDIITQLNGISVTINNDTEIIEALIEMKNNYNKFNREGIRKRAIEKFGAKTFLQQLLIIYREQK